jgi:DNA-binding SARP family transcriptional activator/tetratricopeptide (TPR) repeat protein
MRSRSPAAVEVGMDFEVLGPVRARSDGEPLPISGAMRNALLALLLLRANRVVPADWLIDVLWESAPPRTAPTSLQVMVHHVRRALGVEQGRLQTQPRGYLLKVAEHELDLHVFANLTARARTALAAQAYPDATADLRKALDLWRGPALGGATSVRLLRDEAGRLDELRLAALEDRVAADLALGRAGELVDELAVAVAAHPTRERLRGQLMLALHRSDRTTDALTAYRDGRRILVRDVGIEPGAWLQSLHERMLRSDPQLLDGPDRRPTTASIPGRPAGPVSPPLPAQLPHDVPQFTGRARELAVLSGLGEAAAPDDAGRHVPVVVIDGMPGVGKTALALHFAYRIADQCPDGQLYLDLHGFDPARRPTTAGDALYQLLTALGVQPSAAPNSTDERAALYRSMLAGKRVLLTLDNAASVQQVRPLLPGAVGCPVIVTSRNRLTGLAVHDGAQLLTVPPLSIQDSVALLAAVIGEQRVAAQPAAARELVERSGRLPLALRISAANLLAHPERDIADFVAELATSPLDALRVDGDDHSAARIAFDLSYRHLPAGTRRLFCLLGVLPGTEASTAAAAALTGVTPLQARADLDRLAAAHLIEQSRPGRWQQHDLLRRYAAERAAQDETDEVCRQALIGLLRHYLAHTRTAVRLLYPQAPTVMETPDDPAPVGIRDTAGAVAWFDEERPNLIACVLHAAERGHNRMAWQLADVACKLFLLRHQPQDWMPIGEAALIAAAGTGDDEGVAHIDLSLGNAHYSAGDNASATRHYARAIQQSGRIGWPAGEAAARANLGVICASTGRPHEALEHYRQALDLHRVIQGRYGEAVALDNIGGICFLLGRIDEAIARHREALSIHQEIGFRAGAALALANIGNALRERGDLDEAQDSCARALQIYREVGSPTGQAQALCCLADIHADAQRYGEASAAAQTALGITEETGDRRSMSEALNILGTVEAACGRLESAAALHGRALDLAAATAYQVEIQEAMLGLADLSRRRGRYADALAYARGALGLTRASHDRIAEPASLIALGRIHLARNAARAAAARLCAAARVSAATGQRLRHGQALALLAEASPVPDPYDA